MLALTRCLVDSATLDHTDGVVLADEHHVWQKAESRRVNLDFVAAALLECCATPGFSLRLSVRTLCRLVIRRALDL